MPKRGMGLTAPFQHMRFHEEAFAKLNNSPRDMEPPENYALSESDINSPQTLLQAAATRPRDLFEGNELHGATVRTKNSPSITQPQFGYPSTRTGSALVRKGSLPKGDATNSAFQTEKNSATARGVSIQPALPSGYECLSSSEKDALQEAFDIFDRDRDGILQAGEVRAACASLGITTSEETASKLLSLGGWSNGLTFHDFVCLTSSISLSRDEDDEIRSMFALFDKGNKGYITEEDLRAACDVCGAAGTYSPNDLRLMVKHLDRDGSGKVYLSEFCKLFKKSAPLASRQ